MEEGLYRCVHCGLCLSSCPIYQELALETESPRGRISLMKAVQEGRLGITDQVISHWELCLQCRACEAACPSGVPFGRLMELAWADVVRNGKGPLPRRLARWLLLRGLLPHPSLLRLLALLLKAGQRSGLRRLGGRVLRYTPFDGLAGLEEALPEIRGRLFQPGRHLYRAEGPTRHRVALLSGCFMPLFYGPTMEAAVRVLNRNGCDVAVPMGQVCCGALHLHSGDIEMARRLARRNVDVFLGAGVEAVVVASAGCSTAMKEYGQLLAADPAYRERASQFSATVVDITEFLARLPLEPPGGRLNRRVVYQDHCHLLNVQRISREPRELLRAIPGLELVEMEDGGVCCGSAGLYSLIQRGLSRRLLLRKMRRIAETGAEVVATANPGCMMHLELGMRLSGLKRRVCHIVDLLDEAYGSL
jgi:glycolate oxidase iron-sulfur subunit